MRQSRAGLTLLEVLLAVSILSLVLLALNALLINGLRESAISGSRTQAVQILNYLGRRIAGGDTSLLVQDGSSRTYRYGTLANSFQDLPRETGRANPNLYQVTITNRGKPTWADGLGVDVREYEVEVCWRYSGGEACTRARTFSAPPSPNGGTTPLLEGIN
ncbi:MAG: prepilin-type N-terminal cleavage/methylation domain-containing protein [Thermus sp.]|nr:prepilin-type N-terminal cleavage/methylation domain-containing protein [Thermus sp.]